MRSMVEGSLGAESFPSTTLRVVIDKFGLPRSPKPLRGSGGQSIPRKSGGGEGAPASIQPDRALDRLPWNPFRS